MRATDVATSLRRIPVGFHACILIGKDEYRTTNKRVSLESGTIEWMDHFRLPTDTSTMIHLRIYASFELGSMLGRGELLRRFSIGVRDLVDRSNGARPIVFLPRDGEIVAACSSLEVNVCALSPADLGSVVLSPRVAVGSHVECYMNLATDTGHGHMLHYYRDPQELHLDRAITQYERVLDRCPEEHSCRGAALSNLAMAKFISCLARDAYLDLDIPISLYRQALDLRPQDHPDHAFTVINLANALLFRFNKRGYSADADEAEELLASMLDMCPTNSHEHRAALLLVQTFAMHDRSDRVNGSNTVPPRPSAGSDNWRLPYSLDQLYHMAEECQQRDDSQLLDSVVSGYRHAGAYYVAGQPEWIEIQGNLAAALSMRFERQGREEDLNEAIQHTRDASVLTSTGHRYRPGLLNNLANSLTKRFRLRGMASDLDEAIEFYNDALALTPIGHSDRSMSLSNLAVALTRRFEQRGMTSDLDEAIGFHRDALALRPTGHSDRSVSLNNLAVALMRRFEQRGMTSDLDEAIGFHRDALALTPTGHSDHSSSLNNLANALMTRFEQRGMASDLDEAIGFHRDALALRPTGHSHCSLSLNSLANALTRRFEQRGMASDLDEAIGFHRDALALTPTGQSDRSSSLNNLAVTLRTRFEQRGMATDADELLTLCHAMGTEISSAHPVRMFMCYNSACIHLALWNTSHMVTHLDIAMDHYKAAAGVEPAGLLRRLRSCLAWVNHAEQHRHVSCLDAYTQSLQLLDAHVSATASVSDRHATMKDFPTSLAVDAASCALRQGDVPRALELLEQGRALLWNQLTRFRTPLDDLRSRDAHAESLVRRFQELSLYLSRQSANELEPSAADLSKVTTEAEANRYRRLVDEWNQVVAEIRTLDGFSRFLLPPLFSDLQDAASEGPVVVLVASRFSCDAIIVLHDQLPVHIVLDVTLERLAALANHLQKQIYLSDDPNPRSLVAVLRELWDTVMSPVVSKLEDFVQRGSRIWWCPTSIFTAFPLHAVGEYRKTSKGSVAAYISSYTPSLSTLIKARKTKFASSPVRFAAIGQALPDGHQVPLECVDRELDEIERLLPSFSVDFTKLPSVESTKQRALHALRNNPWLHFSCHGSQNFAEPFKSHLKMRDGHLFLLDIINSDLSMHEFAFLSACKTAVGDRRTLDEAIHLAAGLQFMGVKSVVGTLWSVRDDVAYSLVTKFYEQFCSGGKMDPSRAARALHQAILSLARDKVPLEDRMLFIHIGV